VIGCAAIGALAAWAPRWGLPAPWRIGLQVGVLGGFTTFSSFGLETFALPKAAPRPRCALRRRHESRQPGRGLARVRGSGS
jgi:fluoride ion exporter CrcB/FEX